MIGSAYQSKAVQAILGPARSSLFPSKLWVGWLDGSGDLIAMSGTSVPASGFSEVGGGVSNTAAIDAGTAGSGWVIAGVGLFCRASDFVAGPVACGPDL